MNFHGITLVICLKLFLYFNQIQSKELSNIKNDIDQDSPIASTTEFMKTTDIVFDNKTIKCNMYKICLIEVFIKNTISIEDLIINSNDDKVLKFKSISACDSRCPSKKTPTFEETATNNLEGFTAYAVEFEGVLIGKTSLKFFSKDLELLTYYDIIVSQPRRIIDMIFQVWVYVFGFLISFLMGILLDKDSIVKIVKMPKPIIIGFCCQYLIMPVLAFCIAIFFNLTAVESLAIFIYGCCPGGAGSNNWTILFNGDIDLSAVLTFVSVCSSMGMMPLWVYTLGRYFSSRAEISIPLVGLFVNLLITIVPCLFGLVLSNFKPKLKKAALRIAKPLIVFVLISFLILVIATKLYSFKLLRTVHWISGPLIPWIGYLIGGFVAFILRLPFSQVKTVAIETGIQNIGVAFLIIYTNFPSPEADFATLPIMGVAFLTNIPLYLIYILIRIINCFKKKDSSSSEKEPSKNKNDFTKELSPEEDPMLDSNKNKNSV